MWRFLFGYALGVYTAKFGLVMTFWGLLRVLAVLTAGYGYGIFGFCASLCLILAAQLIVVEVRNARAGASARHRSNRFPQTVKDKERTKERERASAMFESSKSTSWMPDFEASECKGCFAPFTFYRRRHHCRACGSLFCDDCTHRRAPIKAWNDKRVRLCGDCFNLWRQHNRQSLATPQLEAKKELKPEDLSEAIDHLLNLQQDYRLLAAHDMLRAVKTTLAKDEFRDSKLHSIVDARAKLDGARARIEQLETRATAALASLKTFQSDEDWTFAITFKGIDTYYRLHDDGTISVKLEGAIDDCDPVHGLAVVREVDLFKTWAPFCEESKLLRQISHVELLCYLSSKVPLLPRRDVIFHGYGVDCTREFGLIVLIGKSPKQEDFPDCPFPEVAGWGADRAEIHSFEVALRPTGRRSSRVIVVVKLNPKINLPQSIINFCMKNMAGIIIYLIQVQAKKVGQQKEQSEHYRRIMANRDFYEHWLQPKFEEYFALLEGKSVPQGPE